MIKQILSLAVVVLVLSACQKEVSLEDPDATPGSGGPNTTGTRLFRSGTRLGADSVTIDYSYNSANYLTGLTFSGNYQGLPITVQQKINRNASNVITSIVVKSPLLPLLNFGRDSLVTEVVYDANAGRYVRSLTNFIYDNEALTDSTIYSYSNAGRINAATVFFSDGTADFSPSLKTEYAFAENNLVETKLYEFNFNTNSFDLEEVNTFRHDDKTNPLPISAEAHLLMFSKVYPLPFNFWLDIGLNDFFSVNNISNTQVSYISTSESEETESTYTYNGRNRPETCTRTIGGATYAVTRYFYQ